MSKTDLFISELLSNYETREISETHYRALLAKNEGYTQQYIKDLDIYHNVSSQPFPLFKVIVLIDHRISTNYDGGYNDYLEIVFKHKGKYYYCDLSEDI
ncbi:MAG: hypothetical protein M0R38_10085 [Bacteroidia bacterium]|nr:hypothetical protein [Bacteroidia bacterium]